MIKLDFSKKKESEIEKMSRKRTIIMMLLIIAVVLKVCYQALP
jgi:hypothetical protein